MPRNHGLCQSPNWVHLTHLHIVIWQLQWQLITNWVPLLILICILIIFHCLHQFQPKASQVPVCRPFKSSPVILVSKEDGKPFCSPRPAFQFLSLLPENHALSLSCPHLCCSYLHDQRQHLIHFLNLNWLFTLLNWIQSFASCLLMKGRFAHLVASLHLEIVWVVRFDIPKSNVGHWVGSRQG